jgi:hypothetical protein
VRRGTVEPLCERCYREAMARVARELAAEAAAERRARYRRFNIKPGPRCISEELMRERGASTGSACRCVPWSSARRRDRLRQPRQRRGRAALPVPAPRLAAWAALRAWLDRDQAEAHRLAAAASRRLCLEAAGMLASSYWAGR